MQFHSLTRLLRLATLSIAGLLLFTSSSSAQSASIIVNMGALEAMEVSPSNVFSFQVINNSGAVKNATIKGTLHYRHSPLQFTYTFSTILNTGTNSYRAEAISPAWNFSDNGFRELFQNYSKLPYGTYEYCVEVVPKNNAGESAAGNVADGCVLNTVNDVFLINLVTPENNAKLYELYPMFNWVVTYPFTSELTYRIRIAEQKDGQNPQNAITRNNPIYQDGNVLATTTTYPVYAKPLQKFTPYIWTVDAYYKGILLGGAEAWKFTIIEDSELKYVPREQSYYEFEKHDGDTRLYAVGELKLKYITELQKEMLTLSLTDADGKEVKMPDNKLPLKLGDNRIILVLKDKLDLGHKNKYTLHILTTGGKTFEVPFTYINPLYL